MAFLAVTAIFPPTGISTGSADLMRAAATCLAALRPPLDSQPVFQLANTLVTLRRRIRPRTWQLPRSISVPAAFNISRRYPHLIILGNPVLLRDGNYSAYNFASVTPALPPGDRQVYYGSFTRDLCDKYLTVFGDFKYARSYFSAALAAVPFTPDPFHIPGTPFDPVGPSGPNGISVRSESV